MNNSILRLSLFSALIVTTDGAVIYSHDGEANPTTEGWGRFEEAGAGAGLTQERSLPGEAWRIQDVSSVVGSYVHYRREPSPKLNALAASIGWELSTTIRLPDNAPNLNSANGFFVSYSREGVSYQMFFTRTANGDPRVTVRGDFGGSYTLEGLGDSDFHSYSLVYDPVEMSVDLYVDGVERISNYLGENDGLEDRIGWGASGGSPQAMADFAEVTFSVPAIPEPSTPLLMVLAGGMLTIRRSRRGEAL